MTFRLIQDIALLDADIDLHLARILLLIYNTTSKGKSSVKGITKLVKMDFLLRYPKALERSLQFIGVTDYLVDIKEYEKFNIESKMIRFKYGPWDPSYRTFLILLYSKGLIELENVENTINIMITENGKEVAEKIKHLSELEVYDARSIIIKRNFDHLSATEIKELVYKVIPEILDLKFGDEILI